MNRARQVLPYLLAVALPLLILVEAGWLLHQELDREAHQAKGGPRGDFACEGASIVIVGSSRAETDIDPALLARLLPPPQKAMVAMVHGSSAPVWYAVLRNGIYARGCRPSLVVIYDVIDKLLAHEVLPDEQARLLAPYLSGDDPVIAERIFHRPSGRSVYQQASALFSREREAFLHSYSALSVGLWLKGGQGSTLSRGRRILDIALERVFPIGQMREGSPSTGTQTPYSRTVGPSDIGASDVGPSGVLTSGVGALPVAAPTGAPRALIPATAEASFLPELLRLTASFGSRLVVARAPSPPSLLSAELAPEQLAMDAAQLLRRNGARYLDLRQQDVLEAWYADVRHMNALGREANTRTLAIALVSGQDPIRATSSVRALDILATPCHYATAAPTLEAVPLSRLSPVRVGMRIPSLSELADDACEIRQVHACASPVLVLEDGSPLPHPHMLLEDVEKDRYGRYGHRGELIVVSSTDGSDPLTNGRTYSLSLDPSRGSVSKWLYPGDRLTFSDLAEHLKMPASALSLWVRAFSPVEAASSLHLQLEVGPETWLEQTLPLQALDAAPQRIRLPHVLEPGTSPLTLTLEAPSYAGYLLVVLIRLEGE